MYRLTTTRRGFLVYLTLIMAALYVLRVTFNDAPQNIDVREQLAFIGAWTLGYGSGANPPLFTWLAKLAHAVIGKPVAAIELIRFVALWLACVFTWLAARRLLTDGRLAALAGLAPFSSIMLGWEAIFRYSNTTLLIMSVAFAFYALVRLDQRPSLASYLLLGVAIGVGLMSKVNFAVFLVALAAGALCDPGLRARLLDRRMVVSLGAAAVIVSPLVVWLATRSQNALSHGHQRMTLPPSYEYLDVPISISLLLDVMVGMAGIGVPLLVLVALLAPLAFRPGWGVATGDARRYQRCLAIHLAVMLGLIFVGLLLFEVTQLQVRYFFVFGLLIMLTILRVAAANLSEARLRVFGTIVAAIPTVAVMAALVRGMTYGG
jgi:4-amino-4-deoxy-L-arabinose transferase-like glycosyltransferase